MFTNLVSHLKGWLVGIIEYHNAIKELSRLSDRELDDIGITRCDIESIASNTFSRCV